MLPIAGEVCARPTRMRPASTIKHSEPAPKSVKLDIRRGPVAAAPGDRGDGMTHLVRTTHHVGFRDDRYWSAYPLLGGPHMTDRTFDR